MISISIIQVSQCLQDRRSPKSAAIIVVRKSPHVLPLYWSAPYSCLVKITRLLSQSTLTEEIQRTISENQTLYDHWDNRFWLSLPSQSKHMEPVSLILLKTRLHLGSLLVVSLSTLLMWNTTRPLVITVTTISQVSSIV